MVRIGERLNLSTFGAVGDKSKGWYPLYYYRVAGSYYLPAIWVATRIPSVPVIMGCLGFFCFQIRHIHIFIKSVCLSNIYNLGGTIC